jgi:type IV secretory pathway VirB9-like protein
LQATFAEDNNPAILIATNNQYHFNLVATNDKVTSNSYVFEERSSNEYNSHNANVDNGININFSGKKLYGAYDIEGDVKSAIRPVAVFNDGKRTYIQMNNNIDVSDLPTVYAYEKNDKLQTLAGVRYRRPFFVIDGIRPKYALIVGSTNSDDVTRVNIKLKKDKQGFWGMFKTRYVE